MGIIDAMIGEFTQEVALTRKILERVPEDNYAWQPHEKSMTLGRLASHIAENPGWVASILQMEVLDMDAGGYVPFNAKNKVELLETFDEKVAEAMAIMPGQTDEHLVGIWRMKMGGKIVMEMPRVAVLRMFLLSHTTHHRGQLSVYLRMLDVSVPSIYGPSADEQN